MKSLVVLAFVTAFLGVATPAHAICPLLMQKAKLLLSDRTPPPSVAQEPDSSASKETPSTAVGKTH